MLFAGLALAFAALAAPPVPRAASAAPPYAAAVQTTPNQDPVDEAKRFRSLPGYGTADSNGSMIAVTGIDLTGSSILYLIDTERRQLAIYQASGGTDSMQGIKLVGARKIDLDLQLEGYNDKSEYSYEELEKKFADNQRTVAPPPKKP